MTDFDLSGHVILLVDDVAFSRETIRRVLRSMNEPTVIDAANGAAALVLLNSKRDISFVIADFNMPGGNGLQLLQAVRTGMSEAPRDLPVAMLTGHTDQPLVANALALDVSAFVVKPVSADALGQRIAMMLRQAGDKSWLKSPEAYLEVRFPGALSPQSLPRLREDGGQGEEGESKRWQPDIKFDEAMVEAFSGAKFQGQSSVQSSERSDGVARSMAGRIKAAGGPSRTNDSVAEIEQGVRGLIVDSGMAIAQNILAVFEMLLGKNTLTNTDIAEALAEPDQELLAWGVGRDTSFRRAPTVCPLSAVPIDAILSGELRTTDGQLILPDGTPVSPRLAMILQHLNQHKILAAQTNSEKQPGPDSLAVRFDNPRSADGDAMALVPSVQVQVGAVLANDLFLHDGRPYLPAGATLTDRSVTLLQDLSQLQGTENGVWIKN